MIRAPSIQTIITNKGPFRLDPSEVAYVASDLGEQASRAALVAKELITGDLGVDRMDYLRRDSLMCGVSYGLFDLPRMVQTLMLARSDDGDVALALEQGGMYAAEGLLTARYFMFSQVYYHDIRVAYDEHLLRFLRRVLPDAQYPDNPAGYLEWDDVRVLGLAKGASDDPDADAILRRKHYRRVYELSPAELGLGLGLVERLKAELDRAYGTRAFVVDSRKSTRSLGLGQILVVDTDTGQTEDLLKRSTTLEAFKPIWLVRIYASHDDRTDVLTSVKAILAEATERKEPIDG